MNITQSILKTSQTSNLAPTRDQMMGWIQFVGNNVPMLVTTLNQPVNTQFKACVCSGECTSDVVYPITLYGPGGTPITGPSPAPSAGPATPLYYDANGAVCSAHSPSCFFQVTSSFLAECTPDFSISFDPPLSCTNGAEFFKISYSIQQTPWTLSQGNFLGANPTGSIYMDVSTITLDSQLSPSPCN
jgi:hypothetical protein